MSEENVELVRWVYEEGYARRKVDMPGVEDRIAPDYRFHTRSGFPGRTVYRLDEMTALWADLDTTFSDHRLVPQRYEALGRAHVLVTLEQTARLRGSDQRIDQTVYMLWRLADGRVSETWTFTDEAEARAAAATPPSAQK